ncbi:hypothetical protein MRB53_040175 [Persea americana]|nr:hypothetical protein MRB53_040175 [Persea americana]
MARHTRYLDVSGSSLSNITTSTSSTTTATSPTSNKDSTNSSIGPYRQHQRSNNKGGSGSLNLTAVLSTLVPDYSSYYARATSQNSISPLTLSSPTGALPTNREEFTRIQLHRQRLRDQHSNALLSTAIPGYRTSAAFFASLRTNLRLNASPPPSPMSTPPSMRGSASSLPPPSPLATAVDANDVEQEKPSEDPFEGVPELKSYKTDDEVERIAALKLVADSVAQMRQNSNNHLIAHPLNLAIFVVVLAVMSQILHNQGRDFIMIGMGSLGLASSFFALCRYFTQDYIYRAEGFKYDWLDGCDVIITKFGQEIIGAIVIEWISGEARQKKKKAWRGEIKGWTVRLKFRRKGVGSALLEDAVQLAKSKGAESLEFSQNHANSHRVLPPYYSKPFDRKDKQARLLLQELWDNTGRSKRK